MSIPPNSSDGDPIRTREVGVIAEAVGRALDDVHVVADAFDEVDPEWREAVGSDAGWVLSQVLAEAYEGARHSKWSVLTTERDQGAQGAPGLAAMAVLTPSASAVLQSAERAVGTTIRPLGR